MRRYHSSPLRGIALCPLDRWRPIRGRPVLGFPAGLPAGLFAGPPLQGALPKLEERRQHETGQDAGFITPSLLASLPSLANYGNSAP